MKIARSVTLLSIILISSFPARSQEVMKMSRAETEALFLKENLLLIAEKLNVPKAEATVVQAKLWPNPNITLDEVNLWAGRKQLSVFGDELQGFNGGSFGRNQQVAFSIDQLIYTAGKRKKLVALEQVSVDKSKEYFEELLRNLKLEFRNHLTNLQYLQYRMDIYQNQMLSIKALTQAYLRQVEQGNIGRNEYIRLKALELEIAKSINGLAVDINETQKELKLLMRLPYSVVLEIKEEKFSEDTKWFDSLNLENLILTAKTTRPDYKLAKLDETYYDRLYAYEKAQRIPNLTLKAGYDRGGNFMYNFFGFGVSMDLPLFHRNQGNILQASIGLKQSKILSEQMNNTVENQIVLAYQNLGAAVHFLDDIDKDYENTIDTLLKSYTKNFSNRNISMLEYIDFLETYMENKRIILDGAKDVYDKLEELNYSTGSDYQIKQN